MKKKQSDYFHSLFEDNYIPSIITEVNCLNGETLANPNFNINFISENPNTYHSIIYIPNYLKPLIDKDTHTLKKGVQYFKGFAIIFNGFDNVDSYLKHRSKKTFKAIKRNVKRLDICFQVSSNTFHGFIKQDEYNYLMDSLKNMIKKRFKEKNTTSIQIEGWSYYSEKYFELINNKKATLFVLYHNNIPISISLNNIFKNNLFGAIGSYDIDFSKFSLGNIEIYKTLEWCFKNNILSYDFGPGDLPYKSKWANNIYNFEHQIIYPKNNLIISFYANMEFFKLYIKEYIYKTTYKTYKRLQQKIKQTDSYKTSYKIIELKVFENIKNLNEVDYNKESHSFLRRFVFDFLYSNIENVKDVKTFEVREEFKSYIIQCKSKAIKISFYD